MTIITQTLAEPRDYAWLQAEIIAWSHRADLASRIPGFIELAEKELFRELSLRGLSTSYTGTTSGGTLPMPADADVLERIEIAASGNRYTLTYSSPNGIEALTGSTNQPSRFLIEDGAIRLLPAPDGPYSYTVYYLPVLAALSGDTTSNWLLDNHADLYLKAGLAQVARFTKNAPMLAQLLPEVAQALDSIKRTDERKRFPAAGGMQIKPRSYR